VLWPLRNCGAQTAPGTWEEP